MGKRIKYNRIKVVLVEQEKTNTWLSQKLRKSKVTISRWCTNESQPSLESLFEVARILEVSPRELIVDQVYEKSN